MEAWREELYHHGIQGQHWGVRRWQNKDGSVTPAGAERYYEGHGTGISGWGNSKEENAKNGTGGGGSTKPSNEESEKEAQREGTQNSIDRVHAMQAERVERLRKSVAENGSRKKEEEGKEKSGSSKASTGVSMSDEEFMKQLSQILGVGISNNQQETAEEPEEEKTEEAEEEEEELSEEDAEEVKNFVVDPVTEKAYKIDPETGDAYAVNPSTGEVSDTPVKLEESKLENLVEAVKSGAKQFQSTLQNILSSIRKAREERKHAEEQTSSDAYQKARDSMMSEDAQKAADKAKAEKNENQKTAMEEKKKKP